MSEVYITVYTKRNLDVSLMTKVFELYDPSFIRYVRLDGTLDEYWEETQKFAQNNPVGIFFVVWEGMFTKGRPCFRVIYRLRPTLGDNIQIMADVSGLWGIALASAIGNNTPKELLQKSQQCDDEVLYFEDYWCPFN